MALLLTSVIGNAIGLPYLQDDRTRNRNQQSDILRQKKQGAQNRQNTQNSKNGAAKNGITAQPILSDEDSIPDSLLHPRWTSGLTCRASVRSRLCPLLSMRSLLA